MRYSHQQAKPAPNYFPKKNNNQERTTNMKKLIAIIAVAMPLAFSARAQWIVYDPISNVQQILDETENIAEYVDMVENQVQQIETLDNQLSEFKNYESLFGNPSQVALSMVGPLDTDLHISGILFQQFCQFWDRRFSDWTKSIKRPC